MVSDSVMARINQARRYQEGKNCIGTAFYIIENQDEDKPIDAKRFKISLSGLVRIPEPREEALAVWSYRPMWGTFPRKVMHMGVVTGLESISMKDGKTLLKVMIAHRLEYNKPLVEQSCEEISERYGRRARFYVPR